jgi:hypothetical protein
MSIKRVLLHLFCDHRDIALLQEGIGRQGDLVRCKRCSVEFRTFVEGD